MIWRKWLEPNDVISALLWPILHNETDQPDAVRNQIHHLSEQAQIRRMVNDTDVLLRPRHRNDVTVTAFSWICKICRTAVGFANRWIHLQESHPGQGKSYYLKDVDQLKRAILPRYEKVCSELSSFEQKHPSPILSK